MKKFLSVLLTLCALSLPAFARMPGEAPVGPDAGIPSSVYDTDADGLIDNDAGGTELDTSASTGLPKIESGIWSVIAKGTANQYLRLDDSLNYVWGVLPGGGDMVESTWATGGAINVAKGGTGKLSWTLYALPYMSGTTTFGQVSIGAYGQCLKVNSGADGYEWGACGTTDWAAITGKPTTIFGYGIVDAAPLSHTTNYSNPHTVTKSQVGLSNVENTQLSTWAGAANITTIGTLSSGTVPFARLSGAAPSASPTFTGTVTIPSPFTIGATSVTTTGAQLNYLNTATSNIQTQIGTKSPTASPTFTGTLTMPTPFTLGATSVTATGAEMNYLAGVTSAIQTQINSKQATITDNSIAPIRMQYNEGTPGSGTYYRGDGKWMTPTGSGDMAESVWATGGAINVAKGGTQKTSWTQYAIPYLTGATTFGERTIGTDGQCLKVGTDNASYTWGACGTGAGDVVGPASATANAITLFDGATGKLVKDSTYTITAAGAAILDDVDAAAQRATLAVQGTASPTFTGTLTMPSPFTLGATSVTATGAELNYVAGATSAIQTQIDTKSPTASPTFTGTVTIPSPFTLGATSVTVSGAEINYLASVTSGIQAQLNGKEPTITAGSILPTELQDNSTSPHATKYYRGDGRWIVPTGTGDVVGPASATDNAIVIFNGTGGKTIKDSTYTITAAGAALIDDASASAQRTTLGLGTIATQASGSVSITGGTITGVTMDAKQNYDADLSTLSVPGADKVFYSNSAGGVATVGLGTSGTFLKSQGAGSAPTWSTISATPGGSDTQVQINDGGAFGGDAGFTYNKTLNNLSIDNTVEAALFKGKQSATIAGYNRFYELSGNGTNYIGFTVPDAITATYSLKLPDDEPGSEMLSCAAPSGGVSACTWKLHPWEGTYALLTPADADDIIVDYARKAITLTAVACIANGTTPSVSINLQECDQDGASNCASVLSAAITCNGGYDTGSISDSAIAVDHTLKLIVNGAPTGTVSGGTLFVTGTQLW